MEEARSADSTIGKCQRMYSFGFDPGDSTERRLWRKIGVTKRKIFALPCEFIPGVLNEAKQIIRLCPPGSFVEKLQNVRTYCAQFVETDVSSSIQSRLADCSKVAEEGVCLCDFIVENELSTRR